MFDVRSVTSARLIKIKVIDLRLDVIIVIDEPQTAACLSVGV